MSVLTNLVASTSSASAILARPRANAARIIQSAVTCCSVSSARSLSPNENGDVATGLSYAQAQSSITSLGASLREFAEEYFPSILLAVPKHKTSHSRKSMRSANKGLKNKTNISVCPACGAPKLSHHICPNCYSQITRKWKQEARSGQQSNGNLSSTSISSDART